MLKYFKSYNPSLIVVIPLLGIILWGSTYIYDAHMYTFEGYKMPLYALLVKYISNIRILSFSISLLITLFMAILMIRLNKKYIIIPERTYLPAALFVLISGSLAPLHNHHPVIFGSFFLLFAIDKVFSTYKENKLSYKFFEAAFLIGISSLFYLPLTLYIIILWVSLIILGRTHWREWIFTLLGFITPYIFVSAYYLLYTNKINTFINGLLISIKQDNLLVYPNHFYYIFFGFLLLCIIFGSYFMMGVYQTLKIHARKYYMIFLWLFLLTTGIYFLIPSAGFELIFPASIPISYLLTKHYISSRTLWWCNLIFILLLASLAIAQYMYLAQITF